MVNDFYPYLDSFNTITIVIKKENYKDDLSFSLEIDNNTKVSLDITKKLIENNVVKLITFFEYEINLNKTYYVLSSINKKEELAPRFITKTSLFDTYYSSLDVKLGPIYSSEHTIFRVWSPLSKYMKIELTNGIETHLYDLVLKEKGVWETKINKDLEGYKYRYHFYIYKKEESTYDPYSLSISPDNTYSYVIDKNKFYIQKYNVSNVVSSPIIYEASIRDFTSYFKDLSLRGKYELFTKEGLVNNSGIISSFSHVLNLGITHIQIMPIFYFGGVIEEDEFSKYNWGYNPLGFFSLSGVYSKDANNPYMRINEVKKMIDNIHKNGLKVVMDVVYNHVYMPKSFSMNKLCPYYIYLYDGDAISERSGCENDLDTSKNMVRKIIIESLLYLLEEFNLDGFRFDLMGLIDTITINEAYKRLKEKKDDILFYGEGWAMAKDNSRMANMYNKLINRDISFFNDNFRNNIKEYSIGNKVNHNVIKNAILGSSNLRSIFRTPNQSINYTECHDDLTFYDFMIKRGVKTEELKDRAILSMSLVLLSLGIPFISEGQELLRSKNCIPNTYNLGDEINMINWDNLDEHVISKIKELIDIRKNYSVLNMASKDLKNVNIDIKFTHENTILFKLENENYELLMIFKNSILNENIKLDGYKVLSNSLDLFDSKELRGIGYAVLFKEV